MGPDAHYINTIIKFHTVSFCPVRAMLVKCVVFAFLSVSASSCFENHACCAENPKYLILTLNSQYNDIKTPSRFNEENYVQKQLKSFEKKNNKESPPQKINQKMKIGNKMVTETKSFYERPVSYPIYLPIPITLVKEVPVPVKVLVPSLYPVIREVAVPFEVPVERPVPYKINVPVPFKIIREKPYVIVKIIPVPYKVTFDVLQRYPLYAANKKALSFSFGKNLRKHYS